MKIAFIFSAFESIGIEYLSASLKRAGHQTALFFDPRLFDDTFFYNPTLARLFDDRENIIHRLAQWEPDIVAISVLSDTYQWALDMARRAKSLTKAKIVFGGIHPTSVPDIVIQNEHVDFVVQGEGDEAFVELVQTIEDGGDTAKIPNVWSKKGGEIIGNSPRPLIKNLDALPFPDKSLYHGTFVDNLGIYTISASRGCPYRCSYCNVALLKEIYKSERRSYWRVRSVDNVIEELKGAIRAGVAEYIIFYDEVFAADIRWLREFAPRYRKEIAKPFIIATHPGHATEEYVALLKEAGCVKADLGVQTTDPQIRKNILHRYETNEQIETAIKNFRDAGIFLFVENIINLPTQTEEHLREMARFYNRLRPNSIKVYGLKTFPRTPIENMALEHHLITEEQIYRNHHGLTAVGETAYYGGTIKSKYSAQIQMLFAVMLFLPPNWVDTIIEKKLYRYFPPTPTYVTFLNRLLNAQDWQTDLHKRLYGARYKHYIVQKLKSALNP